MLIARKEGLANETRQRQVAIRERELLYYTKNCRMLGDLAALVAGFAYSGIRYHYLLERQTSFRAGEGDALAEMVFLSLLTACMGLGLQTVLIAMLVAMLGPSLALRGPDGSLADAVAGMQGYTKAMLALHRFGRPCPGPLRDCLQVMLATFMAALGLLLLSALTSRCGLSRMRRPSP
jgi:hypothetical protein